MRPLLGVAIAVATFGCGGSGTPIPARPTVVIARAEPPRSLEPSRGRVMRVEQSDGVAGDAAERIRSARELAARFEHQGALEAVNAAQVLLERDARTEREWNLLHEALVLRGILELELDRPHEARSSMQVAARLRPRAQLDPARFPPDAVALYAEVAAEARAARPASLAVTTRPAGATVTLDGERVGIGPITVQASPGQHYVRVDAIGHEGRVLPVTLAPTGNPAIVVDLPRAQPGEVGRQIIDLEPRALVALDRSALTSLGEVLEAGVIVRYDETRDSFVAIATPEGLSRGRVVGDQSLDQTLEELETERLGPPLLPTWAWVLGAVVLALAAGAAIYYYGFHQPALVVQVREGP